MPATYVQFIKCCLVWFFFRGILLSEVLCQTLFKRIHWFTCFCGFLLLIYALRSCLSMHICLTGFLWLFVCPLKFAVKLFLLSNFSTTYTESTISMTQFQKQWVCKHCWNIIYAICAQNLMEYNFILLFDMKNFPWVSWTENLHLCDTLVTVRYMRGWKSLIGT